MKIDLNVMGYDELLAHGEEVMRAIRLRAYGEGYRQGKFDADMDAEHVQKPNKDVVFITATPENLAQARRDEIVEQAKADIEVLKSPGRMVNGNTSDYKVDLFGANAEFIVNREKRTVVALLKGAYSGTVVLARGIAKAAPSDCFNVHIGKAIALRRALGLAVPDEYLNAPQPTEVRVGDVVHYSRTFPRLTVSEGPDDRACCVSIRLVRQFLGDGITTIIDDSREEVGE
ncbi:hypothetical protein OKW88_21160 [Bacillus subtilis]|uniref:hypothetical protein n=1 Tax=Bacillus subtilis TaxID=1423 RepID=UPI0038921176